jgi:hypothetical protein
MFSGIQCTAAEWFGLHDIIKGKIDRHQSGFAAYISMPRQQTINGLSGSADPGLLRI